MIDTIVRDLRFALRQIARAPIITGVSVLLLALGIAVNSALFSFLDTVLLQPMPGIDDTRGLVRLYVYRPRETLPGRPQTANVPRAGGFNYEEFLQLREQQGGVLLDLGAQARSSSVAVDANGQTAVRAAMFVTGAYFSVMRLHMTLGSGFPITDDRKGDPEAIAVVSYRFWQSAFGADSGILGRTIRINRVPFTIVGVLPQKFRSSDGDDIPVWVPLSARRLINPLESPNALSQIFAFGPTIVARLRPDGDGKQASIALSTIAAGWGTTYGKTAITRVVAYPHGWLGPDDNGEFAKAAAAMFALTVLILLIACANVSVLLLGRAVARRREIALRLAIGAERRRVVGQLLTENILLAVAASTASIFIVGWSNRILLANFPEIPFDFAPSWRTALVTLMFAAGTGVLFGLLPALHATRASINDALKSGGGSGDVSRSKLQRRFVIAEVAMSTMLICATGLLINELRSEFLRMRVDRFASDEVLALDLSFGSLRYSAPRIATVMEQIETELGKQPDVRATGVVGIRVYDAILDGPSAAPAGNSGEDGAISNDRALSLTPIDPHYFDAKGGKLLAGRAFTVSDREGSLPVVIVDSTLASKKWPRQNAVGQILRVARPGPMRPNRVRDTARYDYTVVGVVQDRMATRASSANRAPPEAYVPFAQLTDATVLSLFVRTTGRASDRIGPIQQIIRTVDPDISMSNVATTKTRSDANNAEFRQVATAVTTFGLVTLIMACVGVYAVIAFGVAQRTREIGIRIALGARNSQVVGIFFRDGLRLALVGTAIGIPLGLTAMYLLIRYNDGDPNDLVRPAAIATIALVLIAVAAFASWLPSRGAARVDPMDALRSE